MIPNGGGTFIAHTVIIIVNWIIKKPIHFLIILMVFGFFSTQILLLAKTSVIDNNLSYLQGFNKCFNNKKIDTDKKYIILRLDDVQAGYLADLSIKIIEDGFSRKIPFTLGVIPMNLYTDKKIVDFINKNQCNLEVALHGFNNRQDIPEFQDISKKDALVKINAGINQLFKITNKQITTFIPPDNIYSTGTIDALKSKQFKIVSGEGDAFYDYTTSTYFFDKKRLNDIDSIIEKSMDDIKVKGFSIIMIHPQDYIDDIGNVDLNKYSEYIRLLNTLKKQGFSFTTMQDYYNYLKKEGIKTDFFDRSIKELEFNKINKEVITNRKG